MLENFLETLFESVLAVCVLCFLIVVVVVVVVVVVLYSGSGSTIRYGRFTCAQKLTRWPA